MTSARSRTFAITAFRHLFQENMLYFLAAVIQGAVDSLCLWTIPWRCVNAVKRIMFVNMFVFGGTIATYLCIVNPCITYFVGQEIMYYVDIVFEICFAYPFYIILLVLNSHDYRRITHREPLEEGYMITWPSLLQALSEEVFRTLIMLILALMTVCLPQPLKLCYQSWLTSIYVLDYYMISLNLKDKIDTLHNIAGYLLGYGLIFTWLIGHLPKFIGLACFGTFFPIWVIIFNDRNPVKSYFPFLTPVIWLANGLIYIAKKFFTICKN